MRGVVEGKKRNDATQCKCEEKQRTSECVVVVEELCAGMQENETERVLKQGVGVVGGGVDRRKAMTTEQGGAKQSGKGKAKGWDS